MPPGVGRSKRASAQALLDQGLDSGINLRGLHEEGRRKAVEGELQRLARVVPGNLHAEPGGCAAQAVQVDSSHVRPGCQFFVLFGRDAGKDQRRALSHVDFLSVIVGFAGMGGQSAAWAFRRAAFAGGFWALGFGMASRSALPSASCIRKSWLAKGFASLNTLLARM